MGSRLFHSVYDLVGDTPLVRLAHVAEQGGAEIWAKLEDPMNEDII